MPKGDPEGRMSGFQLWANLPRSHKMMDPRYQDIKSSQIPELSLVDDIIVRVICGEFEGIRGPVENVVIDPLYLDITIPAKTSFTFPVHPAYTAFAYVIDGKASFCKESDPFAFQREGSNYFDMDQSSLLGDRTLILFEDGDQIRVDTKNDLVRFLFVSGRPLHEPIAWYGPIVMNSEQELRLAFSELQNGTFIKTSA
jgi:redox-sensitive bicupin YhaK (pirin superfamily)